MQGLSEFGRSSSQTLDNLRSGTLSKVLTYFVKFKHIFYAPKSLLTLQINRAQNLVLVEGALCFCQIF